MKVLATYNIKGGVGKTATAVNLAHVAAAEGNRVLVWDLDPQGAATFYFRVKPKVKGGGKAIVRGSIELGDAIKATDFDNLDLVPADFSYRHLDLWLDDAKKPLVRIRRALDVPDGAYFHHRRRRRPIRLALDHQRYLASGGQPDHRHAFGTLGDHAGDQSVPAVRRLFP